MLLVDTADVRTRTLQNIGYGTHDNHRYLLHVGSAPKGRCLPKPIGMGGAGQWAGQDFCSRECTYE